MKNQTVINATIQEQVYRILREEIVDRKYQEGDQLKEAEIAQRFNISRSPVREALYRLAGDGILTIIPNRGIFVKEFTDKYIMDALDMRYMLEERGLSRAGQNMTEAVRGQLLEMRGQMQALVDQNDTTLEKHSALDGEFHDYIMERNDNTFVREVAEKIAVLNSMFIFISLEDPARAIESQMQHIAIIDNLLAGDTEQAIAVYQEHIRGTKKRVVEEFELRRNARRQ